MQVLATTAGFLNRIERIADIEIIDVAKSTEAFERRKKRFIIAAAFPSERRYHFSGRTERGVVGNLFDTGNDGIYFGRVAGCFLMNLS